MLSRLKCVEERSAHRKTFTHMTCTEKKLRGSVQIVQPEGNFARGDFIGGSKRTKEWLTLAEQAAQAFILFAGHHTHAFSFHNSLVRLTRLTLRQLYVRFCWITLPNVAHSMRYCPLFLLVNTWSIMAAYNYSLYTTYDWDFRSTVMKISNSFNQLATLVPACKGKVVQMFVWLIIYILSLYICMTLVCNRKLSFFRSLQASAAKLIQLINFSWWSSLIKSLYQMYECVYVVYAGWLYGQIGK